MQNCNVVIRGQLKSLTDRILAQRSSESSGDGSMLKRYMGLKL